MGNSPTVITVKSNYASYNLRDNSLLKEIEDIETYKTKSFDFLENSNSPSEPAKALLEKIKSKSVIFKSFSINNYYIVFITLK